MIHVAIKAIIESLDPWYTMFHSHRAGVWGFEAMVSISDDVFVLVFLPFYELLCDQIDIVVFGIIRHILKSTTKALHNYRPQI